MACALDKAGSSQGEFGKQENKCLSSKALSPFHELTLKGQVSRMSCKLLQQPSLKLPQSLLILGLQMFARGTVRATSLLGCDLTNFFEGESRRSRTRRSSSPPGNAPSTPPGRPSALWCMLGLQTFCSSFRWCLVPSLSAVWFLSSRPTISSHLLESSV